MFTALHIVRTHAIQLPLPASRAFSLFTPQGERRWVPDWNPLFLHPSDGSLELGAVFLTQTDSDTTETIWLVLALDLLQGHVAYARITPSSRLARVDILVTPESERSSRVRVSYEYTALSEAGNTYLMGFTEDYFQSYIDSWQELIVAHLSNGDRGR